MLRVTIMGCGRGSLELADFMMCASNEYDLEFLDDRHETLREFMGMPVVGPLALASARVALGAKLAIGIANSKQLGLRRQLAMRAGVADPHWHTLVPNGASVSPRSVIGCGTVIYPGARIAADARIGRFGAIYYNAVVHHDCSLGEGVVLAAGALLAGGVEVGDDAYIGIGAVVREHVRIGEGALVGAGAVVTRDVAPRAIVAGVPARARNP